MAQVPIAGRGVVLQRGYPLDEQDAFAHLDHPRFRKYLTRWQDSGENFLMYAIADSGLHFTFEISRIGLLAERLDRLFFEFAARKKFCSFKFQTDVAIKDQLATKVDHHLAHSLEFRLATTSPQDIKIERVDSARYGHVLFATIPVEIIRQRDLASFLLVLDSLVADLDSIQTNWMQLRLKFTGWESDTRYFHEIPAIRAFMQGAMASASWWLALVHPSEYVKWFGALVTAKPVGSKSGVISHSFNPDILRTVSGMAVLEASHMLDSTEIEQCGTRNEMMADLRMAIQQLEDGVNLVKADPLAASAMMNAQGAV